MGSLANGHGEQDMKKWPVAKVGGERHNRDGSFSDFETWFLQCVVFCVCSGGNAKTQRFYRMGLKILLIIVNTLSFK